MLSSDNGTFDWKQAWSNYGILYVVSTIISEFYIFPEYDRIAWTHSVWFAGVVCYDVVITFMLCIK